MLKLYAQNKLLFAGYLLFLILALSVLLIMGKADSHLFLTSYHTPSLDVFMKTVSGMGNGVFMVLAGLLLFVKRIRYGLIIMCSFVTSSALSQFLKRIVFPGYKRPEAWFGERGIEVHRILGVEQQSAFSFPSGHTITAFALFFGLAFFVKNKYLKLVFLFLAILTAYSRIFLSQHFLEDVIAGSVVGVFSAVLIEYLINKWKPEGMEQGLFSAKKKKHD